MVLYKKQWKQDDVSLILGVIRVSVETSCCFIGHRKINVTEGLKTDLFNTVIRLITEDNIDTFLFGSKSAFNDLCYETVTEIKKIHPLIKRVYVRSMYPYIDESYENYLLELYDETYFPESISGAGRAAYVERNYEMINKCSTCVVYYLADYTPPRRKTSRRDIFDYQPKSGTKVAYDYAVKKGKRVINLAE